MPPQYKLINNVILFYLNRDLHQQRIFKIEKETFVGLRSLTAL